MQNRWIVLGVVAVLTAHVAWARFADQANPSISRAARAESSAHVAHIVSRSLPADVEIRTRSGPGGLAVQEYIAADGRLFAISWAGPQDASVVLGRYFPQSLAAGADRHVVVRSVHRPWGSEGVAYLPLQMPLDFDPNTLTP